VSLLRDVRAASNTEAALATLARRCSRPLMPKGGVRPTML
jgi:hypothetical protein